MTRRGFLAGGARYLLSSFFFLFSLLISLLQKTARVRACLGCQQAQAKCQVGGPREEESPEEGGGESGGGRRRVRRRGPAGGCG